MTGGFIALGSTSVQVCTAIMHYGFRIVEDMIEGLNDYLDSKGFKSVMDFVGKATPSIQKWETLDLHYQRIATIDYDKCIGCNLCYTACEDGSWLGDLYDYGHGDPVVTERQADVAAPWLAVRLPASTQRTVAPSRRTVSVMNP